MRSDPTDTQVGVAISECGTLINQALDMKALIAALKQEPHVHPARSILLISASPTTAEIGGILETSPND